MNYTTYDVFLNPDECEQLSELVCGHVMVLLTLTLKFSLKFFQRREVIAHAIIVSLLVV